ncbi:MAG TPA: Ig-like domain-containing protein, partial [Acidimicrobiia bacterium]|nr:Ig-like domain-containing protein [Acidimicrobiia bacterium]
DPAAGEPANNGVFTFTRSGPTTSPLTVNYTVTGTATAGSDYTALTGTVTIPTGQATATQPVNVIDDTEIEGAETVIATITADAAYTVGTPSTGTVNISDDEDVNILDVQVAASTDDAEERSSGSVSLNSSDLELVLDKNTQQIVGVRFTNITIPQGSSIVSAWIQFQTDEVSTTSTDLTIRAQADDNAGTFLNSAGNITTRPTTTATAFWSPPAWNTTGQAGPAQRTPELASLIQEVISRPGWADGNSIAFVIAGTGTRIAEAFDGSPSGAPILHLEYTTGSVPNRPPAAVDDAASAVEETASPIDVAANDFDPDGNLDVTTTNTSCSGCSSPANGALINHGDGSFTYTPDAGSAGSDTFVYEICDFEGLCDVATVNITILSANAPSVIEVRVNTSTDDAEERSSGSVKLNSSDLELVFDKNTQQIVGMRFTGITIPQGSVITSAWIQFQTDSTTNASPADLTIRAQAHDNPGTFTSTSGDISGRATTSASTFWSPGEWLISGEAGPGQQTPDLSSLVQEVVDRTGWASGNSMVFIVSGTGSRIAEAYDGFAAGAPLLHIEISSIP